MEIQTSPTVGQLFAALARAQKRFPAVEKDARNPHLKSQFASLPTLTDALRPVLNAEGLALSMLGACVVNGGSHYRVVTMLGHESGEWVRCELDMATSEPKGISPQQATGILITYARRYTLEGLLGFSAGGDYDGSASDFDDRRAPAAPAAAPLSQRVKDARKLITGIDASAGPAVDAIVHEHAQDTPLDALHHDDAEALIGDLMRLYRNTKAGTDKDEAA